MAYIYKITNKINNKSYIGKTEHCDPVERFKEHAKDSTRERCEKRPLYSAMNKYGVENFSFEILEQTDTPNEREIYYIEHFGTYGSSGYNATRGGDGKSYINPEEVIECYETSSSIREVAKKMSICTDTVSSILKKNNITLKDPREGLKKPVLRIDKYTNVVLEEYESITEAGRAMGNIKYKTNISRVCRGLRKTTLGFKWRHK